MAKLATKNQNKSVRTTASIPADDYAELERIAEKNKVSVAWVIRHAIERYLDSESPLFRRGVKEVGNKNS